MGMPCQVDIESRDSGLIGVGSNHINVAGVFLDKTSHGGFGGW